tara:strand:- start:40 stop:159 length:120 start_codon:yes stop_codon:yes gene_type:complete
MKDLQELEKHFKQPLWLITILLWILAVGLVILMSFESSM